MNEKAAQKDNKCSDMNRKDNILQQALTFQPSPYSDGRSKASDGDVVQKNRYGEQNRALHPKTHGNQ